MTENGPAPKTVTIPRWVLILFAVGVCLDLAVGAALGLVAVQARHAASTVHILRVSTYEFCIANNDAKAADLARWKAIVTLLKDGHTSPGLTRFIDGVQKANIAADAPRDCGRLLP